MHQKKILIADDSELNRALLVDMLERDYGIIEVADGQEAIAALQAHQGAIEVLLLDEVMPGMDGFEVLAHMNRTRWIDEIPVIMISAETSSAYIDRAFKLGAADYVSRPFVPSVIRRRIILRAQFGKIQAPQRIFSRTLPEIFFWPRLVADAQAEKLPLQFPLQRLCVNFLRLAG